MSSADRDVSHEPIDQVTSTPRQVSVEERRRLVAAALDVRNPASRSRDLPDHADPRVECPIEVSVDDIRPYEGNPRRTVNARFDEIKASIRASGIRSPLTVTRRPGDSHFIVEAGGNTRLEAIHQLWAETREPRFGRLTVLFRPWRSETHVLTAHLVENEQRGGMTFWDKACGVVALKAQLEAERGHGLSLRQLDETMRALGMPVNTATLAHYLFATERLRTLCEGIPDLTGLHVKTLQPRLNQLRRYAELQCGIDEDGFYASLLEPAFSQLVVRYRRRPEFSADLAMRAAEAAVARTLGIPVAEVKGGVSTMGRSTDTTAPSGAVASVLPDKLPAGARRTVDHAHEQASATVSTANGEAVSRSVPQQASPSTEHSLASRSATQLLRSRIEGVIAISGLEAHVRVAGDDGTDIAFAGLPGDGDDIASSGVRRHVRDLLIFVTGLVASGIHDEDGDAVPCVPELSDGGNGNALLRWLVTASDPAACASWEVLVAARDVLIAERQMPGWSAD